MADKVLDAKGMNCPLPILKTKKALKEVPEGGTLEVLSTDPGSVADFQAFCRTTGNELLEYREDGGVYTFIIRKKPSLFAISK
jgi:tRNA 2-thiouridine synthesizing protein A